MCQQLFDRGALQWDMISSCGLTNRRWVTVLQDLYLWEQSTFLTLEWWFPKGKEILTMSEGRTMHLRDTKLPKCLLSTVLNCSAVMHLSNYPNGNPTKYDGLRLGKR